MEALKNKYAKFSGAILMAACNILIHLAYIKSQDFMYVCK